MSHKYGAPTGAEIESVPSHRDYSRDTVFLSFDNSVRIQQCSCEFLGHSAAAIFQNFEILFEDHSSCVSCLELIGSAKDSSKVESEFYLVSKEGEKLKVGLHCASSVTSGDPGTQVFLRVTQTKGGPNFSPDRFNSLIGTVGCYFWEINLNANFTHVNASVEAVLGYKNYQLIGQSVKRINSKREFETFNAFFDELKATPRAFSGVKKNEIGLDGMAIPVEISAEPIYNAEGELSGFRGLTKSLYSQQAEQNQLEELQSRYNSIISDSQMWFWEIDAQRRFTYLSTSFTAVTFIPVEQVLGKSTSEQTADQDSDFNEVLDRNMDSHHAFHREQINYYLPSGKRLYLASSGAPYFNADGSFGGYRGHNRCITQEIEGEARRELSEARFKNIVESSNTWFWEVDANLILTYLSANFTDITGYEVDEHVGSSLFDIREKKEVKRLQALLPSMIEEERSFKSFVGTIRHKSGRVLHIESTGTPFWDEDGKLIGWRGGNRDMTNEIQYKEALEDSETRFRHIVETSNTFFWEVNLDLEFTYLSGNFESLTGYSQEEAVGKQALFLHTEVEQNRIKALLKKSVNGPEILTDVKRSIIRKDGSEIITMYSGVPVFADGKLVAFRGHERDVTQEQNLRNKLHKTLNHTQAIVSSLPDMIFVINNQGDIVNCENPDPTEIGDSVKFIGKNIRDLYSPGRAKYFLQVLKDAFATEKVSIVEYRIRNAEGEKNHYESRIIKIEGRDDQVLVITRNVTRTKLATQKLEITLKKLQRSNEELEQFAYVASHDLQEPIRLVSSYIKLLGQSESAQFAEKDRRYLDFMAESCQRMKVLVIDLLEFSKLEAKELKINRIDIKSLFDPILLTFDRQIRETEARLTIGRMPHVMCDPVLLSQVFANLISNGLKFHEPGEAPKISISAKLVDRHVEFIVEDEGVGIAEDDRERIFSIFHRGQRTIGIPGTGIGMAVCRKIVNRHGGEIWISSKKGSGTTIHFTIPETVASINISGLTRT